MLRRIQVMVIIRLLPPKASTATLSLHPLTLLNWVLTHEMVKRYVLACRSFLCTNDYAQPLRKGDLWYLNVHSGPPYCWQRCEALLYPHMLLLSWIAPAGGRGIVTLDLLNCTEVRSVPSLSHPSAKEDVGTIAARAQIAEGSCPPLMELLCPFQLLYSDGVERLAAESARQRTRWVGAIWYAILFYFRKVLFC